MALRMTVAELEALFTANTTQIEQAEKKVQDVGKRVESKPITKKVDADPRGALDGIDRVENGAKKLVSERAILKLDADIDRAEKNLQRAKDRLEDLHVRAEGGLDVTADVARAEASIQRLERHLSGLQSARNVVDIDVDPTPAETRLDRFLKLFKKEASDAGEQSGRSLTQGLDSATRGAGEKVGQVVGGEIEDTLVSALAAIPIAGGIVLAGVAIGKAITSAIQDGLSVEAGRDRLAALTGLDERTAAKFANAAGEAYANVFGDSIEKNMDTARLALQLNLIDRESSVDDAKAVIEGLSGIADVLGEDVQPVARTVAQLLRTGLARSAKDAFDILAAGARNGANISDDLLDTLTEYPTLFRSLGLSGEESLGLISQGMKAGARNSNLAADALKEFQLRASNDLPNATKGFELLGMSVDDSMARVAAGGASARDVLAETLTKLGEMPPGLERSQAAAALFGTQAEDLGEALFAMDLSTAVAQLDGVSGAAQRMFDTLAGNDKTKIEQAQRNIEVAAQGIQGALAAAFAEPLGDFADWVSQNRGPLLQFFSDLVNGAIDFGVTATQSFGDFVSGPLAEVTEGLAGVVDFFNGDKPRPKELDDLAAGMRDFKGTTDQAVAGLEIMRGKFNDFADPQIQLGLLNDASLRLADATSKVGGAQGDMESQVRGALAALSEQIDVAAGAGEQQGELYDRYKAGTDALVQQMVQTGMTEEAARTLIDTVMKTPVDKKTTFSSNAAEEQAKVQALNDRTTTLDDGTIVIRADTTPAENDMSRFFRNWNGTTVAVNVNAREGRNYASGAIVEFMADGGLRGLTPMPRLAQMVPPSTYRVVGDRTDVPELYAPLDGSARSWALLQEGVRRMPGAAPESLSVVGTSPTPRSTTGTVVHVEDHATYYSYDPTRVAQEKDEKLRRALDAAGLG